MKGPLQVIDTAKLAALESLTIGPEHKSLPPAAWGLSIRSFLDSAPRLRDLQTPIVTLDTERMDTNQAVMTSWCAQAGVELAPHGKTTMAPQLWDRQLKAGAWAITLATGWQAQLARSFGVQRILLANELVDPVALRWISDELDRDPEFEFVCWADSVETVKMMERALDDRPMARRIGVLVELGAHGGRTGARTAETALAAAEAIVESKHLELSGVGGWEGVLGRGRTEAELDVLHVYLTRLANLHRSLAAKGLLGEHSIVTAGGSAFPDLVVEHLAPLADDQTTVVLRSGCYLTHDDGVYADVSPLRAGVTAEPLRSALHAWARVISQPEPGLALLDAGRRDVSFDARLPVPQRLSTGEPVSGEIVALNDQHSFLRSETAVGVGAVLRLGVSHPCTVFDKWRLIPVIDDADHENPRIVDLVHTYF